MIHSRQGSELKFICCALTIPEILTNLEKLLMTKFTVFKSILVICSLLLTSKVLAPDIATISILAHVPVNPYERLIRAVTKIESGGDTLAFNPVEEAFGAFQIRPIRVNDYNQRTGNNFKASDCLNYDLSRRVFLYYADRIGFLNYETIARNWNGSGKTTADYWERVKKYL
jgi:hypothetical protein